MAKYNLQHNEAVLLSAERVQRGTGRLSAFTDELVLTNLHLIWVNKGIVGNVKRVEYLPLALVKVFNDQAQARLSKSGNGIPQLEVFFQNGEEVFKFQSGGKREIAKWIDAINRAVTGNGAGVGGPASKALPGTGVVAETLRDTLGQFRASFGGGKGSGAQAQSERVSTQCPGCGASISGITGTVARCEHCDSESRLP
jgi:hypothetical protein